MLHPYMNDGNIMLTTAEASVQMDMLNRCVKFVVNLKKNLSLWSKYFKFDLASLEHFFIEKNKTSETQLCKHV